MQKSTSSSTFFEEEKLQRTNGNLAAFQDAPQCSKSCARNTLELAHEVLCYDYHY
jgi:hypothetical protein